MAGLILKSPYIKGQGKASGYMKYIATRDGVEKLKSPPCGTEGYLKYMASRPRSHGLFGDENFVSLDKAMKELECYSGRVWTHILSLKREDAARLGYNSAEAWRDLLRAHRNEIAKAMNISAKDFRWYAAFHDEGEHPHVHMMAWSAKPGRGYLSRDGLRQIRSSLTRDIFQDELLCIYKEKSQSRDELVRKARQELLRLTEQMRKSASQDSEIDALMRKLTKELNTVTGKRTYAYLSKEQKALIDKIVDELEKIPIIESAYGKWLEMQNAADGYYKDTPIERIPLSKQKDFRAIKNAIIRAAEQNGSSSTVSKSYTVYLLASIAQIFRSNSLPHRGFSRKHVDRKQMQKILELKAAHGLKSDGTEEKAEQESPQMLM